MKVQPGEVGPGHVPWQPAGHHCNGLFEIGKVGYAEGDQAQAVEDPRDAQTIVACGETEVIPVPVRGEPGVQTQAAATITALSPHAHQVSVAVGAKKM